jgi:hypothetical protein
MLFLLRSEAVDGVWGMYIYDIFTVNNDSIFFLVDKGWDQSIFCLV